VRADSAFYGYDIVEACRHAGARFSVTARMTPTMTQFQASVLDDHCTALDAR
jgi:hypothetical protein